MLAEQYGPLKDKMLQIADQDDSPSRTVLIPRMILGLVI